jgi:hypothetical protein
MNAITTATVLSAMITPVVLILASGSLILTTSQRLSRVIERTRKLTDWIRELATSSVDAATLEAEVAVLFAQLHKNTRRARLLQRAMTCLYLTIAVFVGTSITIAIVDISQAEYQWIPVVLGLLGAGLLFYASILLIRESRIALSAVDQEMDSAIRFVHSKFPSLKKR